MKMRSIHEDTVFSGAQLEDFLKACDLKEMIKEISPQGFASDFYHSVKFLNLFSF